MHLGQVGIDIESHEFDTVDIGLYQVELTRERREGSGSDLDKTWQAWRIAKNNRYVFFVVVVTQI